MRPLHGFFVLLVGFGCGRETFDLLPPDEEGAEAMAGMAGDGPVVTGGSNGSGGSAGSGFATGGRGGYEEPPPPIPDCPAWESDCRACSNSRECPIGTWCDTFRSYCAPYCDENTQCYGLLVCDEDRRVCVECLDETHCRDPLDCFRGKCVPDTSPECFSNSQCMNPSEPVCISYVCSPCFSHAQCGPDMQCNMGRCEQQLPGPQVPGP